MVPPTSIDGTDITGATIDGTDVTEITVDGQTVFTAVPAGAFDLTQYTFEKEISNNVFNTTGLTINSNGTRLYALDQGNGGNKIRQFNLSTPFDIGSATFTDDFQNPSSDAKGVAISQDGSIMLDTGGISGTIEEISLSTPFELSSANRTNNTISGNNFTGVRFANSGSLLGISDSGNNHLRTFELTTPFDITSRTNEKTASFQNKSPNGLDFSANGEKVFVIASGGGATPLREYNLSTPFDISTFDENNVVASLSSAQNSFFGDVKFAPDGSKLYMAGNSNETIEQYTL